MIGIIGGYGDIGTTVTQILMEFFPNEIKSGGRKFKNICEMKNKHGVIEQFVDISDIDSINRFVENCEIIINCSGCGELYSKKIFEVCVKSECHYVDTNRNIGIEAKENLVQTKCYIHDAGSMPGICEILPNYLSAYFDKVEDVEFYYLAQGEFTYNSAKAFVCDILNGEVNGIMKYEKGICVSAINDVSTRYFPIFNRNFKMYPYINKCISKKTKKMGNINATWYSAYENGYTLKFIENIKKYELSDDKDIIEGLCNASKLDSKLKGEYAGVIVQVKGKHNNENLNKTLIIKYKSPTLFTSTAVVTTIINILLKNMKRGAYRLSESEEVGNIVNTLKDIKTYDTFIEYDGNIDSLFNEIEGDI